MSKRFLGDKKALLTVMVQAETKERVEELMEKSLPEGAEAFGMQFCRMKPTQRSEETYRELFKKACGLPVYVTNYRQGYNENKSDEDISKELITLAECGADLVDVMGDMFDKNDVQITENESAVEKQIARINEIHKAGADVVMSSHVLRFTPAERVLEIALEHKRRGADISKIVLGADNMAEEIENLRIIDMLREKLDIPFLILSGGECHLLRRIGCALGCCMYLCVYEHDALSTKTQPLLVDARAIKKHLGLG